MNMFEFGYKKPTTSVSCWWGARAIMKRQVVDILWDRQNMTGSDDAAKKKLADWLNKKGLPALQKLVKKEFLMNDEEREVCIEKDGYYILANPNRSHGYLYIGAGLLSEKPTEA